MSKKRPAPPEREPAERARCRPEIEGREGRRQGFVFLGADPVAGGPFGLSVKLPA